MAKKRNEKSTPVISIRHNDRRANIPTKELRDFVAEDENKPKLVTLPGLLYARDPSLDPQLVWKGKDDQDRTELTVPAVPIYIQEKIQPQAIIEDLRRVAAQEAPGQQQLFADFNGIKFEDLIDFYHHDQNWSNRMILGDSLLVMTSLAEKEGLKSKVQMIYIDPPYGIRFGSNWEVSTRKRDVKDRGEDVTRQPEQVKAFRDTWKLGIHSYLTYLRDRLTVARELLTDSGSVFVQIGDENVHLVRSIMDEVFGSNNFCASINFVKASAQSSFLLSSSSDCLLWFAKNKESVKYRQLFWSKQAGETGATNYTNIESPNGEWRSLNVEEKADLSKIPSGWRLFSCADLMGTRPATEGDLGAYKYEGKLYNEDKRKCWKTDKAGLDNLAKARRLVVSGNGLYYKRYIDDFPVYPMTTNWDDTASSFMADKIYAVQTTNKVIQRCILLTTDPGELVLDPTCGSGTTAFVAEQWGRRWITVDTSRVAIALARTRLMSARYAYYLLADSKEGQLKDAEISGILPTTSKVEGDIRKGFVYIRVPHITLRSIANNPDVKEGMSKEDLSAAIARHTDQELLYDQPYEDGKRIRVTGPFTVESLSPHRVIATDTERPTSETDAANGHGAGEYESMIIENLKTAGVQNTVRNQRLKFDHLESHAGTWIHAAGEYSESGKTKRVAICIGPEHGTVGPELVKEASKEAVQGVGFDLLVVCGLAFDPHVSEEAKRYGKLSVLAARMNPDLTMGDGLLKKTGAGNLFMVFGEPDIDLKKTKDGQWVAEIEGVDVYDPTTGQVRSHTTDDIACWFIDTDYNGESFFVRHAYFCGADEPYEKLKKALRAEIDESAWDSLNSTKSRPFDTPKTKKIAIKVINHYGDEVLKVYELWKKS